MEYNTTKNFIKGLIHRLESLSLMQKLILTYAIILAIPIIFLAGYTFRNLSLANQEEVIKSQIQSLSHTKTQIYRNIEILERASEFIMGYEDFMKYISREDTGDVEELIEFQRDIVNNIERLQYTNPDIFRLRVFVDNPHIKEYWHLIFNADRVRDMRWYQTAPTWEKDTYWRLMHPDELNLLKSPVVPEVVSMYRKLNDLESRYTGIMQVNMLPEVFFGELYNSGSEESMFCVIQDEREIFSNDKSQLIEDTGVTLLMLKNILVNKTQEGENYVRMNLGSKPVIVFYTFIEPIDSYIYNIVSIENMINSTNRTRNIIILVTLGAFLLLSIVTYFITAIILKKMSIIVSSMREVQKGNLSVDIPVEGEDEIGELAYHFRKMLKRINELISVVVRKEVATKEAEIRALQTQINAHFLYNVLESIKMMAEIEYHYDVADALTSLGRLMRYSMTWTKSSVSLQEELNYIKNYITLLNIRYDNHLTLNIEVEEAFLDYEICKMSIQPIVENAVVHGIEPRETEGSIWIKSMIQKEHLKEYLVIEIADNGVGMDEEYVIDLKAKIEPTPVQEENYMHKGKNSSIGLKNVNERIKLFYGEEYGLVIKSEKGWYTKVQMRLPLKKE